MGKTFINFSNLHTNKWQPDMLEKAMELSPDGQVVNMAFPMVDPTVSSDDVAQIADIQVEKIMEKDPEYVFCQGDFSLCFKIVELLKSRGIKAVTSCNRRVISNQDGKTISGFQFVQFREF